MESYDYPQAAVATLLAAYDTVAERGDFQQLLHTYDRDRYCDYTAMLEECKQIAAAVNIHTYTIGFLLFLCLSSRLREIYRESMWRLFDMDYTGDLDDFPADSTLRRSYLQYLKEGGQVGEGYGVFFR